MISKIRPLLESLRNQMQFPRPVTSAIFEEIYALLEEHEKSHRNLVDDLKSQIVCLNSDWRGRAG